LKHLIRITLLALIAIAPAQAAVLCSWNIERLGHGNQKAYEALGHIGNHCDFIAVQELMTEDGQQRFLRALHTHDRSWASMASHALGRGSYTEMYAFYYRQGTVDYDDGAIVYLDRRDTYAREPYSARFRTAKGTRFAVGTIHVIYGQSVRDRLPEITALADYFSWLAEVYPNTPRMLMGDFNLPPHHDAWQPLKAHAKPLITEGATTLSAIDGRYANLYDNIWLAHNSTLTINSSGIIQFPQLLRTQSGASVATNGPAATSQTTPPSTSPQTAPASPQGHSPSAPRAYKHKSRQRRQQHNREGDGRAPSEATATRASITPAIAPHTTP
jgi:endonuclease/exonuclease/phosphatase family metal-dependent hydrolase